MSEKLNQAMEYLDRGWSIIPIKPDSKRPRFSWKKYQTELPTSAEVEDWWRDHPDDDIAIITGDLSGVVVVDCDNEEAAAAAAAAGMTSPVEATTKRGKHLYFEHPRDGVRRGPRAGNNSRGADWPRIDGLDFRGDGSYALLPGSTNYAWAIATGHDIEDMPEWRDWRPRVSCDDPHHFEFSDLDLSDVAVRKPDDFLDEWERTARYVKERFPSTLKIPTGLGNSRNERVMSYASECVLEGIFGAELRVRCHAFQNEFFEQPLGEAEFEATCRSMEEAEQRNHPERFNEDGVYIYKEEKAVTSSAPRRLITMADAEELMERSKTREYLIEPWLPPATICQVYGYSGHGKSMFVQHAMGCLATGSRRFGPFEIAKPARVLYLDFEMGMGTIARRLSELRQMHGEAEDRLQIWAPFVDNGEINLKTNEGRLELARLVDEVQPDVVVIDTIRSAFPGLAENSADEWAKVNGLAVRLRNAGMSVILVHHSNKPGENGMGREAGSTNQLTVLDTQIRVAQVFTDEETAKQNAAILDTTYSTPVWPMLQSALPVMSNLYMVMELRYGKVREWTEEHDRVQWIGFGASQVTDERHLVSSRSTKQRAKELALSGESVEVIANRLSRPQRLIEEWLSS